MEKYQDAYGREIYDYFKFKKGFEIVERDDGYFDLSSGPSVYFKRYGDWPVHQRKAIRYAKGNVLDIGSGAGRVALYLQKKGLNVLGIEA